MVQNDSVHQIASKRIQLPIELKGTRKRKLWIGVWTFWIDTIIIIFYGITNTHTVCRKMVWIKIAHITFLLGRSKSGEAVFTITLFCYFKSSFAVTIITTVDSFIFKFINIFFCIFAFSFFDKNVFGVKKFVFLSEKLRYFFCKYT